MNDEEKEMLNWKIGQQEFVNKQHDDQTESEKKEEWWFKTHWFQRGYLHALEWVRDSMQECIKDNKEQKNECRS